MVESITSYFRNHFLYGPKFVLSLVVAISIILTIVVMSAKKTVVVSVNGQNRNITTLSSTYRKALSNNGIVVGPKDKTTPSLDSRVENGKKISIKRAVRVQVEVDGKQLNIKSAEDNVMKMLQAEEIKLRQFDKVYPAKNSVIKDGLRVIVTRVETKEIKENKPIEFATVVEKDDELEKGSSRVVQEGQLGEKETVTKILYENGKEVSRKVIAETIKKQPVQKIVAMGTLSFYTPSRGGKVAYTNSMRMRATAYTAGYESTGKNPGDAGYGITATGTVAKRNSDSYSSVAVDPRVIPLGTKLYVEGYGYAIAEDTGGAIKGNKIDLFFNSCSEAYNWGVRWVNVYVVK